MVAASVIVIGILSMIGALLSGLRLVELNRETSRAHAAARAAMERIHATGFDEIYRSFNAVGSDDPGGMNTAPGATFAVTGLRPPPGVASVGTIEFPATGGALDEAFVDAGMGMPRDLDGDGIVGGALGGAYLVLPVRVRITWRGSAGDQSLQLVGLLMNRGN